MEHCFETHPYGLAPLWNSDPTRKMTKKVALCLEK